jgi:DNA-binding NarL/FixJ family response regulator
MNKNQKKFEIAIVDDHNLVRQGISCLINSFENCRVTLEASSGIHIMQKIGTYPPDIVFLDLSMHGWDGYETAKRLSKKLPQIKIIILSMHDPKIMMSELIKARVRGILKKNILAIDLKNAINFVMKSDTHFYYTNNIVRKMVDLFQKADDGELNFYKYDLNEKEINFLRLISSDMTYKMIAEKMGIDLRALDTIRDKMFRQFNVNSRVGLVMIALENGLITF